MTFGYARNTFCHVALMQAQGGLYLRVRSRAQGPNNLVERETLRKCVAEPIEKNELDRAAGALFIETERAKKFVAAPIRRHRGWQFCAFEQALQS